MKNTRFMSRMFSAVAEGDEELTQQVANDIEGAKRNGSVSTDELTYVDLGEGKVEITDNENGEQTIAEKAEDGNYDLYPAGVENQSEQIEGYLHPERDGVTPGDQEGEDDEDVYEDHDVNTQLPEDWDEMYAEDDDDDVCPECGQDPCECDDDDEEREFSVYSDNTVVQRVFSDQVFCERIFSEVIETEDTAKIGNLKIEKLEDEDNAVIVTDENTGDQAKIVLDDEDMEVTELDSKNFSDDDEEDYDDEEDDYDYMPLHVVGVDTFNHQIIDAPEYTEEDAQDLVERLQELGIDGVRVFEDQDTARDYAMSLLESLDAEDVDEPEQVEFSDHDIYVTSYYTNNTEFMTRLFSEACNDIDATQQEIEGALEDGEETETDNEIITPVDDDTVIVEDKDNGELTKVVVDGDSLDCSPISEEEADELKEEYEDDDENDENDEEGEEDEEEKTYSNDEETKFFSDSEYLTNYMLRLFSDEADESDIEEAIENDKQVETDDEIITPVDSETAVIEDKENGEYTKAVMTDDKIDVTPISEEEATKLTSEKTYSNDEETKFFSESEYMTDYMCKVFSDEADGDENDIRDAVESGKKVETDEEIITPIDEDTAIIEDKESGEYTEATVSDDSVDLNHIDEDDAEEMIENADVDDDDDEDEEEEKSYSYMDKFFAEVEASQQPGQPGQDGEQEVIQAVYDEQGNLVPLEEAQGEEEGAPSVEAIEDAALAAVQAINNAANEGANAIMNAKNAPAEEGEQAELQEAQFSYYDDDDFDYEERTYSNYEDDTLVSWLHNNQK